MRRKIKKEPYKVYPEKGKMYAGGVGAEWRCPECDTIFLVPARVWGYKLNGKKYCSYKCLRAAENKKKKK